MRPNILEMMLLKFDDAAAKANPGGTPVEYVVDAYLVGKEDPLTGTMERPDKQTGIVLMNVRQYGQGSDFGMCGIECERISAVRMRKPN